MAIDTQRESERVIMALRSLYEAYGYKMFRMSKFEAYDFYTRNKDFLSDGQVITFSDTDGKLLALKPDITLSIVKDTQAGLNRPERVYYNESVYRVSRDVGAFRELVQIGLEYMGRVDAYTNVELITLALKSLALIGPSYVLDLSHMGFVTGLMESFSAGPGEKERLLGYIGKKSVHGLRAELQGMDVPEAVGNGLLTLAGLSGRLEDVLDKAKGLVVNDTMHRAYKELSAIAAVFNGLPEGDRLQLDFSITNDVKYYNGLLMRGYIHGIARPVLTGGRYDPLLARMEKPGLEAIGFAIGCDEVERYLQRAQDQRYDAVVLYDDASCLSTLRKLVEELVQKDKRVWTGRTPPECPFDELYRITGTQLTEEQELC